MDDIPSKAKILADIHTEWELLERLLNSLSEEQMLVPGVEGQWSVGDILAHISAWEKVLLDRLSAVLTASPLQYPVILNWDDVHAHNARIFNENQGRPLSSVILEFRNLYRGVLTVVEALDEEALLRPIPWDWPQEHLTVWQIIVANTSDHYQEHRQSIEKWLS
jgi:hypothetical protein